MKNKSRINKAVLFWVITLWPILAMTQTRSGKAGDALAVSQPEPISAKKRSGKWDKSYELLSGLKIKPHKSVDQREFVKQYRSNTAGWNRAFAYLKKTALDDLKPGRYSIDGENVYAIVTEEPTKDSDKVAWESHRLYNDIHYVIKGKEKIGIGKVSSATVIKDYDSKKDILFYASKGKYYITNEDVFFIVFPTETHCPGIKAEGYDVVKKIVIKIRTGS